MRKALVAIPLIILLTIVMIGFFGIYKNQEKQSLENSLAKSEVIALPEFSFTDLYDPNKTLTDKDFTSKYTLLNVFASWCSTCRAEHDTLIRLSSQEIPIYGIAWRDVDESSIRYLEENGNPYLKVASDSQGVLSDLLAVNGLPETFVINDKKEIIFRYQGNLTLDVVSYIKSIMK